MRTFQIALLLSLLFMSGAFAATKEERCTETVHKIVGRHLGIENFSLRKVGGQIISESCKTWPNNRAMTMAAFAYDEGVQYEKKQFVALVNTHKNRIVSSQRKAIQEDALTEVNEYSLQIDATQYQLAEEVQAFGVIFHSGALGASCGEARWGNELTLLVPEGKKFRSVLTLDTYRQESIRGCLSAQSPNALWKDASLTIAPKDTNTNGYYDLEVTAKVDFQSNTGKTKNREARIQSHDLHYDGKRYKKGANPPWWLGF